MNLDFAKVCGKHSAVYEAYYKQIDPNSTGAIEAMTAAKFLKKSGLSDVVLSRVWDMSDPNGKGFLDKPGFFVALKLVSLAQAGQVSNMNNIYVDTPNPPKVGEIPKTMPSRIQTVPVSSGGVANGDWSISVIDRLKYEQLFESLKPVNGMLPGNKVKGVLMESKLPMNTLGIIWDLADQDKDGNLDKHEFLVAMHLVYQTLQKRTVPNILPPELRKPGAGAPPPKPIPPVTTAPMPRAPSGEGFGDNGFVANFPKDIAPAAAIPPLPVAVPPMTRIPPVGAVSSQPLIQTDPLIPIGAPPSVTANADWVVTPAELHRFEIMFRDSDRDKDGLVSGLEVKDVFIQSGVQQKCLAHIWALCDTNQSGKLTIEQFALAMWMVERKQKGIEPPQVLTTNMVPPSMRSIISGVDLQTQEPKPTYSNPELEMISKEIEELARERRALETEIAQKEADVRIKNGEVRSLQSELDTLSATLKQLENQRGEAQKRLDDLQTQGNEYQMMLANINLEISQSKYQVNKIREQCQKQEETINEQEGELNAKRSELQKLKDEEDSLQKEYDDNNRELTKLTQHLQNTQLQISSVRSMVTQLMETQRQMTNALLLCRAAMDSQNADLVSEYVLKIEPDFDDARKTLEKEIEIPKDDPFGGSTTIKNEPAASNVNGFDSDPFGGVSKPQITTGFDDSFSTNSGFDSGFDAFGSGSMGGFGQQNTNVDPFGGSDNTFSMNKSNAITPAAEIGKDDFGSDPFAALHAPTGQGQVLSPNTQKSGPPPRPESPSPALPPKKSKVPPPRPAPPRPVQGPARGTQPSNDAFGSTTNTGGFADFGDFDNKLINNIPITTQETTTLGTPSSALLYDCFNLFDMDINTKTSSSTTSTFTFALPSIAATLTTDTLNTLPSSTTTLTNNDLSRSNTPMMQATTAATTTASSSIFDTLNNTTFKNNSNTIGNISNSHSNNNNISNNNSDNNGNKTNNDEFLATKITNRNINSTTPSLSTSAAGTKSSKPIINGPTDFKDDPFKDYRYEDPFNIKDPFDDDNELDVFAAEPSKIFKDDFSSEDEPKGIGKLSAFESIQSVTPLNEVLQRFDAFNLNPSPVPSHHSTHSKHSQQSTTPIPSGGGSDGIGGEGSASGSNAALATFDAFADFDAFSTKSSSSSSNKQQQQHHNNNVETNNAANDFFFNAFNDNFEVNKNIITSTTAPSDKQNNKIQTKPALDQFAVFDPFAVVSTTATKTTNDKKQQKFFEAFNDNDFEDDFSNTTKDKSNSNSLFKQDYNTRTKNKTNENNKNEDPTDNFAEFDNFDAHNFSSDFSTALNNSKNLQSNNDDNNLTTNAFATNNLIKVQNSTKFTKNKSKNKPQLGSKGEGGSGGGSGADVTDSSAAASEEADKKIAKFAIDYSKPESFNDDLEEALKRSIFDN